MYFIKNLRKNQKEEAHQRSEDVVGVGAAMVATPEWSGALEARDIRSCSRLRPWGNRHHRRDEPRAADVLDDPHDSRDTPRTRGRGRRDSPASLARYTASRDRSRAVLRTHDQPSTERYTWFLPPQSVSGLGFLRHSNQENLISKLLCRRETGQNSQRTNSNYCLHHSIYGAISQAQQKIGISAVFMA